MIIFQVLSFMLKMFRVPFKCKYRYDLKRRGGDQSFPVKVKIKLLNTYSFDSLQVPFQQRVQGEDHIVAQTLELERKADTGDS